MPASPAPPHDASPRLHGYGPILGVPPLLSALQQKLERESKLDLRRQRVMVTAGGNQAFSHMALALCDPGDEAVLLAPYYFSHRLALQIAFAQAKTCRWDPATLLPDLLASEHPYVT
jgi:aspartate/methionine/tyrosine aminotransferase